MRVKLLKLCKFLRMLGKLWTYKALGQVKKFLEQLRALQASLFYSSTVMAKPISRPSCSSKCSCSQKATKGGLIRSRAARHLEAMLRTRL